MSYRGPNPHRIQRQTTGIYQHAGEYMVWRRFVSASAGTNSAYLAGGGRPQTFIDTPGTGLFAIKGDNFPETQLPGGQVLAGPTMISTPHALGSQDEIIWRGVSYRVESDSVPNHLGARVWYQTLLSRGDKTG